LSGRGTDSGGEFESAYGNLVGKIPKNDLRLMTVHSLGFASFFMARAAILGIVAFGAAKTYASRMILVITFGDQILEIIMTSTASHFSLHAFYTFDIMVCMVAKRARLPDVFAKMEVVIEDDLAIIRIKEDGFG
jgi:hypothetical protein